MTSWYDAATNETTVYEYFKGGNIASITKGDEVREFLYGINDQLTYYNEKFLTYDNVGNPLNYRDLIRLTWKNGRQMATFKLGDTLASYDYDESGIRTKKTVNGITTTYQLDGSKIVSENRNGIVQSYFYDENGSVLGITYGGENYYFRKNFRNDVLAILNASGEVVVEYSYDPWGNILAVTGSLASTLGADNPFRYRGYYYDTESCFYYLNSRYYDAKVCRFVNADDASNLGVEDEEVLSFNLFAYCMNNPINRIDADGDWSLPNWAKVVIGAVATVAAVAVTVATGGAAAPVLVGVAVSTIGGAATGAIKHRVTTGSWTGAGKAALNGAADGFMTGGLCALGGSVIGGAARTIKNARSGITIGKVGQFDRVAEIANVRHYSGLKEFGVIEKTLGKKAAETVGWWQNKCVVKGVMALKGAIYDCGGALTGAYAKEVALTKGYQYLYNVWLM